MPGKSPLALPADVVYQYDGSFAGFLCCVHQSVYNRQLPLAIYPEADCQPSLFPVVEVETNREKAEKVQGSIPSKISPAALELVETVFLSCLAEKERALLTFLLLGYRQGRQVTNMLGHPAVAPVLAAAKHLQGEAHLLKGFVRFSDYGGVLAAAIAPKNFVLPFLANHFEARYSDENFMIFDKTHKAALIHENRQSRVIALQHMEFPEVGEEEKQYRLLWKQFYNTVAIEARYNPKCRMTHMPKRYWENMVEMQDFL